MCTHCLFPLSRRYFLASRQTHLRSKLSAPSQRTSPMALEQWLPQPSCVSTGLFQTKEVHSNTLNFLRQSYQEGVSWPRAGEPTLVVRSCFFSLRSLFELSSALSSLCTPIIILLSTYTPLFAVATASLVSGTVISCAHSPLRLGLPSTLYGSNQVIHDKSH